MHYPYGNQSYYNRRYGGKTNNINPTKRIGYTPPKPTPRPTKFGRPKGETFTISGASGFPDVIISHKAHSKMWNLVQECDIEISWLSSVIRDEDGDFYIKDVYVPLQECSFATTVITADGEAEMMMELISSGSGDELGIMHCWGHSHVNMDVGASGVDDTQTEEFIEKFDEHFIRFIGNKYGDLNCNVYLKKQGITLNQPKIIIESPFKDDDFDYRSWAVEQIEKKVERATYVPSSKAGYGNVHSHYYSDLGYYGDTARQPYIGYEGWYDSDYSARSSGANSEESEFFGYDEYFNLDGEE